MVLPPLNILRVKEQSPDNRDTDITSLSQKPAGAMDSYQRRQPSSV